MAGDPFGLLLRQRIVFLGGEVEDFGADALVRTDFALDQRRTAASSAGQTAHSCLSCKGCATARLSDAVRLGPAQPCT
jgi:hypothetical protein